MKGEGIMRKGFTLIELLIVITILAVLAGAALPYVQSYVAESRLSKAKADLDEIGRALAIYEAREGDYGTSTVALLTGRYLNKAPIDPWGSPYFIATQSGLVISPGPDRLVGNEDDVTFPYQPPLALVQVKWVDANQTGAVDLQNTADLVQLVFSRRVKTDPGDWTDIVLNDNLAKPISGICNTGTRKWLASKTLVLELTAANAFTPGSDTVVIKTGTGLVDTAVPVANNCLTDQAVIIVPQ